MYTLYSNLSSSLNFSLSSIMEISRNYFSNSEVISPRKLKLVPFSSQYILTENPSCDNLMVTQRNMLDFDDLLLMDQTFLTERNDIKPFCTRKKMELFIDDIRNDRMKQPINYVDDDLQADFASFSQPYDIQKSSGKKVRSPKTLCSTRKTWNMDESYLYESKPQHASPKPMNMNEFLRDLGLENYYKNFKSQDISSTTELINQMTGNADYHLATTYGIGKSGHRKKILLAIEELQGSLKLEGLFRRFSFFGKGRLPGSCTDIKGSFHSSDDLSSTFAHTMLFPALSDWLKTLEMQSYYPNFLNAGFEVYEDLLVLMTTKHSLNDMELKNHVYITNPEHRKKILLRLFSDSTKAVSAESEADNELARDMISHQKCVCSIF